MSMTFAQQSAMVAVLKAAIRYVERVERSDRMVQTGAANFQADDGQAEGQTDEEVLRQLVEAVQAYRHHNIMLAKFESLWPFK